MTLFYIVWSRSSYKSISNRTIYIAQLTLFPRVSEALEADFGLGLAGFRKHLVEHRFLHRAQLVVLTLMKGDEVVKPLEE